MKINVRYFASLREALGAGETLDVADGVTVREVRDTLIARDAVHAAALARSRPLRTALDQVLCAESAEVATDAELAFFPPVTGG